jgi:hypothetical protein
MRMYSNGNGYGKPFSLSDGSRVNPKRFRGWRPQIATLENYIERLAPDDPRRGELGAIVACVKDCDRQVRFHIARFVACTVIDSLDYELVRCKMVSLEGSPLLQPLTQSTA